MVRLDTMTNSRRADIFYNPGDPLFRLRMIARNHRLTPRQRLILRRRWLKNWTNFLLLGGVDESGGWVSLILVKCAVDDRG